MTTPQRLLFICHNHPGTRPGGAEGYAYELFSAFRDHPDFEATFLAKGGPPLGQSGQVHVGTPVAPVDGAGDEYHLFTDGYSYDWFRGSITDPDFAAVHVRKFLQALQPDIVHIQHLQFLGYDLIRTIRSVVPNAVIVFTLHEYGAICHQRGQMVRTGTAELCERSSPRRCHECFPEFSPQDFFLRRRHLQSHLSLVDRFVSPSTFLRDRYVEWGIPPERIIVEPNGRSWPEGGPGKRVASATPAKLSSNDDQVRTRNRFGFFGQINPFKGVDVLLEAAGLLDDLERPALTPRRDGAQLFIHGANLDLQESGFRDRIAELLDTARHRVTMVGPYQPDDLGRLMANIDWVVLPSIWWENAPLVIQEAFRHGRPIICSDIGGMAEQVRNGIDGLHARVGDARSFAQMIHRAGSEPGLWQQLQAGIEPPHSMVDHVDVLTALYAEIAGERRDETASPVRPRRRTARVSADSGERS